jgi:DNA-binding NtrC family response regulator
MKSTLERGANLRQEVFRGSGITGKTILIVDDNEGFRDSLADLLKMEESGLTIHAVENGEQAAAVVKNTGVDLVITDLRMPVMNGPELLLWIREYRPAMAVIVVSACSDAGSTFDLQKQGVVFFDKPLDFTALVRKVRALLS